MPQCKLCTSPPRVVILDGASADRHHLCIAHARIVYRRFFDRDIGPALAYGRTFSLPVSSSTPRGGD